MKSKYKIISNAGRKYGTQFEHRYIMEKLLGRTLDATEHVHHINGNKLDNRVENLIVLNRTLHLKLHQKMRQTFITGGSK